LVVTRIGDYRLTVPAPARNAVAAAGSDYTPGLRQGAVLWSGFSPGNRVLVANVTLDPEAAAPLLPMKVEVTDGAVRLENATATTATTDKAHREPAETAQ